MTHTKHTPNSNASLQSDIDFWQSIENSEDPQHFEDYLKQFPNGQFVEIAHQKFSHADIIAKGRILLDEHGSEALIIAARSCGKDVLEWLKAQGADVDARDLFGQTPMHFAAESNAVDVMEWLKAQGGDVDARDLFGQTPMHFAAKNNAVDAMEWLKEQCADINVRSKFGDQTPMHQAARGDSVDAMEWLKAQGADINARDSCGETPMHDAARGDSVDAMNWLAGQGADINVRDNTDGTPMHQAARGDSVDAMEWLKAQDADIHARDNYGETPMHDAARGDSVDAMEWLKAQGAAINVRDSSGKTPMHIAAQRNAVDALTWLTAQGVDINVRDSGDRTPMHHAAFKGAADAMNWLEAQGADINARDNYGETPMHDAARGDSVDAMEWLKAQGADINARDNTGETPMHDAAWANAVDAMKWLKAQGVDINARNNNHQTPTHKAKQNKAVDAMEWLKAQGADVNVRDSFVLKILLHSVRMVFGNLKQVLQITVGPALIAIVAIVGLVMALGDIPLVAFINLDVSGDLLDVFEVKGKMTLALFFTTIFAIVFTTFIFTGGLPPGVTVVLFITIAFGRILYRKELFLPPGVTAGDIYFFLGCVLLVMFITMSWIAVSWHRFNLLKEYPTGVLPTFRFDRILAYFVRVLMLGVLMMIAYIPMILVVAVLGENLAGFSITLAIAHFVLLVVYFYRLSIILSAAAIGKPISLSDAWSNTTGINRAILLLLLVVFLFQVLVQVSFGALIDFVTPISIKTTDVAGSLAIFFVMLIPSIINVSISSAMYANFIEKRQLL